MRSPAQGWENLYQASGGAQNVLLIGFKSAALKPLIGNTLAQIAAARGTSAEDTIIDLVIEDGSSPDAVYFLMSEENIARNVAWPYMMFGSDAGSMAPEGVFLKSSVHPRAYGNFARLLSKYVREDKVITLTEAIHRLTQLPAKELRLKDRGCLATGCHADIVVFDPATISDRATYEQPQQYSTGVKDVVVNGVTVLKDGAYTGATPGQVVRGPGWKGAR
jgi:N-acyl-D-amino-acid deacylase